MTSLQEMDMMQDALNKQAAQDEGKESMKELFEKKRLAAEKALEEQKGKPNQQEMEDRKARLLAQRDLLRKQKEEKRQQQLEEFKQKTETKEGLYAELKKIDENKKKKFEDQKEEEDES